MLKKFLFISAICCLFFKPIQIFAVDYDEDDTAIMVNAENPFVDTQFCGFEKLKQWFGLNEKQQKKIDEQNEKNFKIAQQVYLEYKFKNIGTLEEVKRLFMKGAQNACFKSMQWLGMLKEELGDHAPEEEKQKYYNDAFSWYVIAFWMEIIKEIKINKIIKIPSVSISKLEILTKKSGFSQKRLNYFELLKIKINGYIYNVNRIKNSFFYSRLDHVMDCMCNVLHETFPYDKKITLLTINVIKFLSTAPEVSIKKNTERILNEMAHLFYNNNFLSESAHCFHNPIKEGQIYILANLILNGYRNTDERGTKFKEHDRNKIGSRLFWKINSKELKEKILKNLDEDVIKFDSSGVKITKDNKYNLIANLCLALKTPFSLSELAFFIMDGKVLSVEGKNISEDNKYEIAANFLRKSKSTVSLVNLAMLIQRGMIKHDANGMSIPEGQQYEVAADLYRKLQSDPISLLNFAILIHKGEIKKGLNQEVILEDQRYEVAADLYKQVQFIPAALHGLGCLIESGLIKTDLNGMNIPEDQRYEVAADLFIRSVSVPESLYHLGLLIENGNIKRDLYGATISEGQQYEIAADLYRKSKLDEALFLLSGLIFQNKISTDSNKNQIYSEVQRDEAVLDLLIDSALPEANYMVALMKLSLPSGKSLDVRKEVLVSLMKAALSGFENAACYYDILKNEIENEEYVLDISNKSQLIIDESEILEIKKENYSLYADCENGDSENKKKDLSDSEDNDICLEVQQQEPLQSAHIVDVVSGDALSEELNLLQRKRLKAFKKKQREQKKKDQSDKFKKFLRGQLSEQEKNVLIPKQKINAFKEDVKIVFDKNAQDQWIGLNAFERNKVSDLIADIKISGKRGKPEKLKGCELFSRRITDKHRLVYQMSANGNVKILSCQGHYDD